MEKKESPVKIRYNAALAELPPILRGYAVPVMEALALNGYPVKIERVRDVKRGEVMDWKILNAIRVYAGLEVVNEISTPTAQEIADKLKLEMVN